MRKVKTHLTPDDLVGLSNALLQDSYGIDYNPLAVTDFQSWLGCLDPNKVLIQPSQTDECVGLAQMDEKCNRSAIVIEGVDVNIYIDTDNKPLTLFGFEVLDGELKHPLLRDKAICEI